MLQHQLTELERRIEIQRHKRIDVAAERALQSSQLTSAKGIVFAIEKDVELAHREGALSTAAAKRVGPWQAYWKDIATRSVNKIDRLENEAIAEQARSRGRSVEIDLLASQESFRDARIGDLTAEHAALSGVRPRLIATRDTLVNWVTTSAWRIILGVLLVWIAMGLILRLVHRALKLWALRAEGVPGDTADDDTRTLTIVAVLSGVARPAVYVVGALVALEIIGINTGPLLGSVAILGLAISFGSQNLVRDIVNGFFILMEHQFAVGEIIEIGGKTGTVERITIRSTWIRQANGDLHVVPNGTIEMVSNLTRDWSRAIVHVGVAYGADIAKVREVCNAVGEALFADPEWTGRVEEAPAWVGVTELGDSAVVVRVMGRVRAGEQWAVQRELNERLKLAFDVAKIEIPYPHRVVVQRPV
jgi:moderate conductance mechanosensitive channel